MSLVNSEAAFQQRCKEVSSDGSLHEALKGQDIRTFRQLAFCIGTPRADPTPEQYDDFAMRIFGASPPLGKVASLRDLHFEATTYVVQAFRDAVSSEGADTQVKKIPMPERQARATDQQQRLVGIAISGELQPSHALVDKCNTIYENGTLVWIPQSACSKRDSEKALGISEKSPILQLEKDSFKLAAPPLKVNVDVSSPLSLQWAWQRRGIAMDQCHLLSWAVHEDYVGRMLQMLTAPVPPQFNHVQLQQLIRADKELWTLLAREVAPPYKVLPDGTIPLDSHFKRLMLDQRTQIWLSPTPKTTSITSQVPPPEDPSVPEPHPTKRPPPKIAKLRKKARTLVPDALKGCPKYAKGPVCWKNNLEGCTNETKVVDGVPRCTKGFHVCAQCHKVGHTFANCRAKPKA